MTCCFVLSIFIGSLCLFFVSFLNISSFVNHFWWTHSLHSLVFALLFFTLIRHCCTVLFQFNTLFVDLYMSMLILILEFSSPLIFIGFWISISSHFNAWDCETGILTNFSFVSCFEYNCYYQLLLFVEETTKIKMGEKTESHFQFKSVFFCVLTRFSVLSGPIQNSIHVQA